MKTYKPLQETLSEDFAAEHNLVVLSRAATADFSKPAPVEIINLTGCLDDVLHDFALACGGDAITNIHEFLWEASKEFVDEACDILNEEEDAHNCNLDKLIEYANSIHDNKEAFLAEMDNVCQFLSMTERLEAYEGHCRTAIAAEQEGKEYMFLPSYDENEFYSLEVFASPQEMFVKMAESDHHGGHPGALVVLTSDEEVARFIKTDGKLADPADRKDVLAALTDFVKLNQDRFPAAYKECAARTAGDEHNLAQ